MGDAIDVVPCDFSHRERCLDTAKGLVMGDRNKQYGEPRADFAGTAAIWTAYLADKLRPGAALDPHDVAAMMVGLKLSRLRVSPGKDDHWIDIAGYAACGMECAELDEEDRR